MVQRLDNTDRDVLDFQPKIRYVSPSPILGEQIVTTEDGTRLHSDGTQRPADEVTEDDLAATKQRIVNIIEDYDRVEDLAHLAQARVDKLCAGFSVKIHPRRDAAVIQAMKRAYPDEILPFLTSTPLRMKQGADGSGTGASGAGGVDQDRGAANLAAGASSRQTIP